MTLFAGTHVNKLDAKGRVSIPASFRSTLKTPDGAPGAIFLRPSHLHRCVEGWPAAAFHNLVTSMESMALFSADEDDMSTTLFSEAAEVEPDREGRIILPEKLARRADVTDSVAFVGHGSKFQIWEPGAAERRIAAALAAVRDKELVLRGGRP